MSASEGSLTFVQSLQMVALAPCIIVIFYLLYAAKQKELVIIPVLYFLSLISGILSSLVQIFPNYQDYPNLMGYFLLGEIFIPSLSFLMIFQLLLNRVPPIYYWFILTIPVVATAPFIFYTIEYGVLCLSIDVCFQSMEVTSLNNITMSAFIFILLVLIVSRRAKEIIGNQNLKKQKYWLVISLLIYNISLLLVDLGLVSGNLDKTKYDLAKTIFKIAFIYIVITAIFRVFTDLFDIKLSNIHLKKSSLTKYELSLAEKALSMLEDGKIYRNEGFNRAKFSEKLGISEHMLSRIINIQFQKSFSDLANEYRVKEAKELLIKTEVAVTTISYDVGFNSIASFNRVFKNITGKSPTQFRENMTKDTI
jgi:AraC-like DNA-binding protein